MQNKSVLGMYIVYRRLKNVMCSLVCLHSIFCVCLLAALLSMDSPADVLSPSSSQQPATPSIAVFLAQLEPLLPGKISPYRCSLPSTGELFTPKALSWIEKGIRQKEEEVARLLTEIDSQLEAIALTRAKLKCYHEA